MKQKPVNLVRWSALSISILILIALASLTVTPAGSVFALSSSGTGVPASTVGTSGNDFVSLDGTMSEGERAYPGQSSPTTPGQTRILTAVGGFRSITVTWDPPSNDGGSDITSYTVMWRLNAEEWTQESPFAVVGASTRSYTITGLSRENYRVRLLARNSVGYSPSSKELNAFPHIEPGRPTNVKATGGARQITVTWEPPTGDTADGGSPITGYKIGWKLDNTVVYPTTSLATLGASARSYTARGLRNNAGYDLYVYAFNEGSEVSLLSNLVEVNASTVNAPGQPTNVGAVAGRQQITVSWGPPTSIGGSAITGYTVQWKSGTQEWSDVERTASKGATDRSHTITGLVNGTEYSARVVVANSEGTTPSDAVTVRTPDIPGTPRNVGAVAGIRQITVSWNPPASDGGSPILRYTVQWVQGFGTPDWSDPEGTAFLGATDRSHTITGLANGTRYTARVFAGNALGDGSADSSRSVRTPNVPSFPTVVRAVGGNQQITVSWERPDTSGGSAITGYTVQWKSGTQDWSDSERIASKGAADRSHTITGLVNGTEYSVRAVAVNDVGSTASVAVTATPTMGGAPGVPTNVRAVGGNQQITVSWGPPESEGASPIRNYLVQWKSGTQDWTVGRSRFREATDRSYTIPNLQNGTEYSVRVRVRNDVGFTSSATVTAVPGVPTAPMNVSAEGGNRQITVSWGPPSNTGGSAITGYAVQWKSGTQDWSDTERIASNGAADRSHTITGLSQATEYSVRVVAVNSTGSTASAAVTAKTYGPAGAPTNVSAVGGHQQITVSWEPPNDDGGLPIARYFVQWKSGAQGWPRANERTASKEGTARSHTITGLSQATEYSVRVLSANTLGGAESDAVIATTADVPGAPTNVKADAGDQQIAVSWEPPDSDGGSPVTGYTVQWKSGAQNWSDTERTASKGAADRSHTITGLNQATEYSVRVVAANVAGSTTSDAVTAMTTTADAPGPPTNVKAVGGHQQVTVSWEPPDSDGGSPVTGYTVQWKSGTQDWSDTERTASKGAADRSHTITGLNQAAEYSVRVVAVNVAGSTASDAVSATTADVPGAPTNVKADAGHQQITVSWGPPDSDGGSLVTGYTVQWKSGAQDWSDTERTVSTGATSTSHTITGLSQATEYSVRVVAVNDVGGTASDAVSATTADVPGAPTNVNADAGHQQITVSWGPPSNDGGSPVTGYTVQWKSGTQDWSDTERRASKGAADRSHTITGLTAATGYSVRVVAANVAGSTASSAISATTTDVAGAPTNVKAAAGHLQITVSWGPPSNDGGSPVTGYTVQWKSGTQDWSDSERRASKGAGDRSHTITGLTQATEYSVRVVAVNDAGRTSSDTVIAKTADVPGAPSNVRLTSGNEFLNVNWNAPGNDGGSSITGYAVQWKSGTQDWSVSERVVQKGGSDRSHTISALANGTEYSVRVLATNAAGTGEPSDAASDRPRTLPGPPTNVVVDFGNVSLSVSWSAPQDTGGVDIIGYRVQWKENSEGWDAASSSTANFSPYVIENLENGTMYDVRVQSQNSVGFSSDSSVVSNAPRTVPDEPTGVRLRVASRSLEVQWSVPVNNGGAAITGYRVEWKTASATWADSSSSDAAASPFTITGLGNGTPYDVRVRAVNSVGDSEPSLEARGTPGSGVQPPPPTQVTAPDSPRNVRVSRGDGSLNVSWSSPRNDGGAQLLGYRIEWKRARAGWGTAFNSEVDSPPYEISGLTNGTEYHVRVSARNTAGYSTPSTLVSATPATLPDAPIGVSVSAGDGSLTVSWSAPRNDGGSSIAGYNVEWKKSSESWERASSTSAGSSPFAITGLENNLQYNVRIKARNSVGQSPASDAVDGIPRAVTLVDATLTVPDKPSGVRLTLGDGSLTVSWVAPDNDGGSEITGYKVEWKEASQAWDAASSADVGSSPYTIGDLSNGKTYDVRVSAVNALGSSVASSVVSGSPAVEGDAGTIPPQQIEGSVPEVLVAVGDGEATLRWAAQGALASTKYELRYIRAEEDYEDYENWKVLTDILETDQLDAEDECVTDLGTLNEELSEIGRWTGDCDSENREGSYARFYTFTLAEGAELQMDLASKQDTYMFLLNGAGRNGAVNTEYDDVDFEEGGLNSYATAKLKAGTYTIEATTFDAGATGDFTLLINSVEPDGDAADMGIPGVPASTDGIIQSRRVILKYVLVELENDVEYYVEIRTVTSTAASDWSDLASVTPAEALCGTDLGMLTSAKKIGTAEWTVDCESENREGSYARFYTFALDESAELLIDLTSKHDPYMFLMDGEEPDSEVVAENDDADTEDGDLASHLSLDLNAGIYTVEATTYEANATGGFELAIAIDADTDECVTDLGSLDEKLSETGEWTGDCESENREGSYARFYTFTLDEPAEVQIVLASEVDAYLFLLDGEVPDGEVVAENDDGDYEGDDYDSRLTLDLEAGTYTIEATTYDAGATGEFELAIAIDADTDECVTDLGSLDEKLSETGKWTGDCESENREGSYARFYTFTLDEPTEVQMVLASEVDSYLFLIEGEEPDGEVIAENDDADREGGDFDSRLALDLEAGTYIVEATTYSADARGDLTINIDTVVSAEGQ